MRTLSDELDVSLNVNSLDGDYAVTQIYHNYIGVFSGHSYKGDSDVLTFNLNDIVSQNRGKDDYLKLNNNKELETLPMKDYAFGVNTIYSRFLMGQIGDYRVWASDGTHSVTSNGENILSGYDYENADIRPAMIVDEYDTDICRIMQGCNWYDNASEEEGNFLNLLLPRVPAKVTNKFGIGLQLYHRTADGYNPVRYSIRAMTGRDVSLGAAWGKSNQTFITLSDLYWNGITWPVTEDSSIYLKYELSSGDEFGDWEEGYTDYKGYVSLDSVVVRGYRNGVATLIGNYDEGETFRVYVQKYMNAKSTNWNISRIMGGDRVVYDTPWGSLVQTTTLMRNYQNGYTETKVAKTTTTEAQYDYITVTPIFSTSEDERQNPDKYIGTCPIAILEACYSRYYLAWNDRYGDIMSQPFDGKIEYSEDVKTDEIADYKLKRRVSNKEVQAKWKLNTKWIDEDVYPMYEAIFTSPYLLLYDTEQDKAWNVIITSSEYKQKTYKTEKSLFNLEIEVEANQK